MGCGWLGLPLAEHLLRSHYKVKGSTTTPAKIPLLQKKGIEPYLISCDPQISALDIDSFLETDVLFVNIPFRKNLAEPNFYRQQMEAILLNLEIAPVAQVIFASSTSVYPQTNSAVSEDTDFIPATERAQILREIEERFVSESSATIIRFGGLYGPDRIPGAHIKAGPIEGAQTPVNLIHRDDCVNIICEVIQLDCRGEIFNACADEHPTRKELYDHWAQKTGRLPPVFSDPQKATSYKIVSNEKLKRRFSYSYQHPNPLE